MFILCNQHLHEVPTFKTKKTKNKITRWQNPLIFTWSVRLQFPWLTASKGNIYQNCKFLASHILKLFLQYLLQLVILDVQDIDTISIWSHLVNKLEHQHNVYIMQQMTKPSNLHLIDRLQFPWLLASIGKMTLRTFSNWNFAGEAERIRSHQSCCQLQAAEPIQSQWRTGERQ